MDAAVAHEIAVPSRDGEGSFAPPYAEWEQVLSSNRALVARAAVDIGGMSLGELRECARREACDAAGAGESTADMPLVLTGHQPLLYHPGVWAKVFMADRLARQTGGVAIECVVDSDAFDQVALVLPCTEDPCRFSVPVAQAAWQGAYFAASPPPSSRDIGRFREVGLDALGGLGLPDEADRFERFCGLLEGAAADAPDLASAVTAARRSFEERAELRYHTLPVTRQASRGAFGRFVADIAGRAVEFRGVHDAVLAEHRKRHGIRSAARPFPDLRCEEERVELPFWHLDGRTRAALWAVTEPGGVGLIARGEGVGRVAPDGSLDVAGTVAPRAVTLTLFNRLVVADVFIHGAGGASYDLVTDEIARRFYGMEPPAYVAVSLTMRLPLAAAGDTEAKLSDLRQRLHRLEHNPDQLLDESRLDGETLSRAREVAAEKATLIEAIAEPGADKKSLGTAIGEANRSLAATLEPEAERVRGEIAALEEQAARDAALTDRTYPFCLWDPRTVRDALL